MAWGQGGESKTREKTMTKTPKIFPPPAGETIQSVFLAALRGLRQYPPSIGKAMTVAAFSSNLSAL